MSFSKSCIVVTSFTEGQPGYLDFSYRIRSLASRYRLTVISAFALTQEELICPEAEYIVIASATGGRGWLGYLWKCASLIRKRRPDVAVLLHSMTAPLSLILGSIPTVTYWNEHPTHIAPEPAGGLFCKRWIRAALRWLMFSGARKSHLVMPIGEALRDDLLQHGCSSEKVCMIYMGVDQSFYGVTLDATSSEARSEIRLVHVGSVHPDRGRDVMLQAMAIVNQKGKKAHLTILGASPDQLEYCRREIQELGISGAVTLYGRVPGSQIPHYLSAADAGLCLWEDLPWYRFNPPTKLFEYLAAGLPVLASNIRTHTEYVKHGENGLVFDYGSHGLAKAIQSFWHLSKQKRRMKDCAMQSGLTYLWPAIEPEFIGAVDGVANGRS